MKKGEKILIGLLDIVAGMYYADQSVKYGKMNRPKKYDKFNSIVYCILSVISILFGIFIIFNKEDNKEIELEDSQL